MLWVRLGKKYINLETAQAVEPHDGSPDTAELVPGGLRVTIPRGREIVAPPGPDVDEILRILDEVVDARQRHASGGGTPPAPIIGHAVNLRESADFEGGGLGGG